MVELARTTYAGFNHVHMSEQLAEREGIGVRPCGLRETLQDAGVPVGPVAG